MDPQDELVEIAGQPWCRPEGGPDRRRRDQPDKEDQRRRPARIADRVPPQIEDGAQAGRVAQ
jgi:hypothetical protein